MDQRLEPPNEDDTNRSEPRTLSKEELREFPPSVKLVFKVLEYEEPLTQKELTNRTRLPQRTVREAVQRLEEAGIVERSLYIPDARQSKYELTVDLAE